METYIYFTKARAILTAYPGKLQVQNLLTETADQKSTSKKNHNNL